MAAHGEGSIDAYVFVRDTKSGQVDALMGLKDATGGVVQRWAPRAIGRYEAFLALEAADLRALQDYVVDTLRTVGRLGTEVLVSILPTLNPLKRGARLGAVAAVVRVRLAKGAIIDRVVAAVNEVDGVTGTAVVTGPVDLLVEVQGDSLDDVRRAVLDLQAVKGIRRTETVLMADPPSPTR
jgi:hypothetical protein